jgi:hypothetical protein
MTDGVSTGNMILVLGSGNETPESRLVRTIHVKGDIHYIGRFQLFWHKCTKLSEYKFWIQFNYFEFFDFIYTF